MAQEARLDTLNRVFGDAALDEGVGGIHVPSDGLGQDGGDLPRGHVAVCPENVHHFQLGIE